MSTYESTAFLAGLFFVLGWLNYKYVPGMGRNGFVGFRTPWSMQSDANWEFANRQAGKSLMVAGVATPLLALPVLPLVVPDMQSLVVTAVMVVCVSGALLWTQYQCRQHDR